MEERKKVLISLPKTILDKADMLARGQRMSRSELVCRAVSLYLSHMQQRQLAAGYREMSEINLELAEESVASENDSLSLYENKLAECE